MLLSIIIPTYNEEDGIADLITYLQKDPSAYLLKEIIVADGGSTDQTAEKVLATGVRLINCIKKGRAAQMNEGAKMASGVILYFLHADSYPPAGFAAQISNTFQRGFASGCYRLQFDYNHWFLKANCWFTRFDVNVFRFGDQSLFVSKEVFNAIGGFNESLVVFEDQDIIYRIKKKCLFKVMRQNILTSTRKYRENGIYKTQGIYFLLFFMYKGGYSQHRLVHTYRKLIRQNKI